MYYNRCNISNHVSLEMQFIPMHSKLVANASPCANGDVMLKNDGRPYIYWNNKWSPISGHFFWDNEIGVNKFCRKLGPESGVIFDKRSYHYAVDAIRLGTCKEDDDWDTGCSGGHNHYKLGGMIGLTGACLKTSSNAFRIKCDGKAQATLGSSCSSNCK